MSAVEYTRCDGEGCGRVTPEGEPLPPLVDREDLRSLTGEMYSDVEGCHDYERAPYTAGDIREIAARIERAAGL